MSRGKAMHQMSLWELPLEGKGEAPRAERSGEAGRAVQGKERLGSHDLLMERVVARGNAEEALERVRRNKGSPGIDGKTVEELEPYLRERWQTIREQLLAGSRAVQLKQWKRGRTVYRELSARGVPAGPESGAICTKLVEGGRTRRDAHGSAGELLRAARGAPAGCTHLKSPNRRIGVHH